MSRRLLVPLLALSSACGSAPGARSGDAARPPTERDAVCPPASSSPPSGPRPSLVLQDGHTEAILDLALSGDGKRLASAGLDGVVRIWDVDSGLLVRRLRDESGTFALALSRDGRRLVTYAPPGRGATTGLTLRVHDLDSGRPPTIVKGGNYLFELTPDAAHLLVATAGVALLDANDGHQVAEQRFGVVQALGLDPEGRRAVAVAGDAIVVMALPSLAVEARLTIPAHDPWSGTIADVALVGSSVWTRSVIGEVRRFDLGTSTLASTLPGNHAHLALGRDALWTLAMGTGALLAWNPLTGDALGGRGGPEPNARKLAASADGTTLATALVDPVDGNTLRLRDAATGTTLRTLRGLTSGVVAAAVSPDGARLVTGTRLGALARWSLVDGRLEGLGETDRNPVRALGFDPTGSELVVANQSPFVRVLEATSGLVRRQWRTQRGVTTFAAYLPGAPTVVTAGADGDVTAWDLGGAAPPVVASVIPGSAVAAPPTAGVLAQVPFAVWTAALSPSGKTLALAGPTSTRRSELGEYVPEPKPALEVAFVDLVGKATLWHATLATALQPRAHLAVSSADDAVLVAYDESLPPHDFRARLAILDGANGTLREARPLAYAAPLAFVGDRLVVGGKAPAMNRWPSGEVVAPLDIPDVDVTALAVDRARGRLLLGGNAGGTSLLDASGRLGMIFVNTPNGEYVTTTPEGFFVSSLDGRRSLGWSFLEPLEAFPYDRFAGRFERADRIAARLASSLDGATRIGASPVPESATLPSPPTSSATPGGLADGWPQGDGSSQAARPGDRSPTRPPRLALVGPPREAAGALSFRVHATSPFRVEDVRAYVDARPVAAEPVCAASGHVDVTVPVTPGRSRITLVASDVDGQTSAPLVRDVDVRGTGPKPTLWVTALGVSRYPRMAPEQQLDFADDDARAVTAAFDALARNGAFARLDARTLLDAEVTAASLEGALARLAAMGPRDLAVVFVAGHGVRLPDGRTMLLTSESDASLDGARRTGIAWETLAKALRHARGRVLVLLDACHSGHVSTELVPANAPLADTLAREERAGIVVFSASRGGQLSYETEDAAAPQREKRESSRGLHLAWGGPPRLERPPGLGHGLFTSALLEALSGKAVDRDGSGAIELGELTGYVVERVGETSNGRQTPWIVRRELFGDFALAPAR